MSCALELPKEPAADNPTPVRHAIIRAGDLEAPPNQMSSSSDYFSIAPHGDATTHLDALCHIFRNGKMYNGFDQREVTSTGARRNSIMAGKDGIVSRGVLLDVPATLGVPYLELGTRIALAELEATEERQGVRVSEGDILLVRTGRHTLRDERGPWNPMSDGIAGLAAECIPWVPRARRRRHRLRRHNRPRAPRGRGSQDGLPHDRDRLDGRPPDRQRAA